MTKPSSQYGGQDSEIPSELPLVPLLSTVVFPGMIVNLQVSRPRNLRLVREIEADQILGLILQKDLTITEEPEPRHLSRIGVAARVINKVNVPGDTVQVILQGLRRFQVVEWIASEPYLRACVCDAEGESVSSLSSNLLMNNAIALFEELGSLDSNISKEAVSLVKMNTEGPGQLADQIASRMVLRLEDKVEILERVAPEERLRSVIRVLRRETQVKKIGADIQRQTQDEIGRAQREYVLRQQLKTIKKELSETGRGDSGKKDLREQIEAADLPEEVREDALAEAARLEVMSPASAEYGVIRTYLESLLDLPWNIESEDKVELPEAEKILNEDHFGLGKIKERIVEFLAVRKMNPTHQGPILCLAGPPGTGKTSLGRSIARATGRKFVRISVGGLRDEAEIRGHRRTYVGAMPGKIIQALRRCGTRNPVFVIDEIDKIGADHRGDPASALLEVLDPEQNKDFRDLYLDAPFDLSKVFFLTTANRLDTIPIALRDRLEILELRGYGEEEKLEIAKRYLIPHQCLQAALPEGAVSFRDDALKTILREYVRDAGVRSLERQIASICRKVAKKRAMGATGAVTATRAQVRNDLGPPRFYPEMAGRVDEVGVATGLAWTPIGGEILFIEAAQATGKGKLQLTGRLGEVMTESAQAAYSYIRSRAAEMGIPDEIFHTHDLHIHIPSGGIPKDGPSAGLALGVAIISLLTRRAVRHDVAMTGEITLRGRVLPVGGVREKVLAARRAGVRTVVLPLWNRKDLRDLPRPVRNELDFIFAENIADVLEAVLRPKGVEGVYVEPVRKTALKASSACPEDAPRRPVPETSPPGQ
ncbi:MAG: endopeptidase La [Acidobacteriota bacterium]